MKKILSLLIITTLFFSCEPEIEDFKPSAGDADFSSYVAIGNSLTAGFMNGELYKTGQQNSFPSMLAGQFQTAGGGEFTQPLMANDVGFGNRKVLDYNEDCLGQTSLAPVSMEFTPSELQANFASPEDQGPYNNMGVPGAKSFHFLLEGYGQLNPYFGRFRSSPTTSILEDAMSNQPTFFTLWAGNNDVLTYAITGGEVDSITNQAIFGGSIEVMLGTLTEGGAKGAIANIPDITNIPFFNTVPYNPITLNEGEAAALTAAYQQYNQGAQSIGVDQITFSEGDNPLVIEETDSRYDQLGNMRQINEDELVLLTVPLDSIKCEGWGTQIPVPDEYILDEQEIAEVTQAVAGYNQTINAMASKYDLAFVDFASSLELAAEDGLRFDGVGYNVEFVSGGLFSLDGIHLTGQGYAIVANDFIKAINNTYNASIPTVSVTAYPGIQYP